MTSKGKGRRCFSEAVFIRRGVAPRLCVLEGGPRVFAAERSVGARLEQQPGALGLALVGGPHEGGLAGAALDVFETEPLPRDSVLWTHAKVYMTPHIASITHPPTACRYIADAIDDVRQGKPWPNLVEPERGY